MLSTCVKLARLHFHGDIVAFGFMQQLDGECIPAHSPLFAKMPPRQFSWGTSTLPLCIAVVLSFNALLVLATDPDECRPAEVDASCAVCTFSERCEATCLAEKDQELLFLFDFTEGDGKTLTSKGGALDSVVLTSSKDPLDPEASSSDVYNDPLEGFTWLSPRGLRFPTYEHRAAFCSETSAGQVLYDALQDPLAGEEITFAVWVGGIEDPGVLNGPMRVWAWEETPSTATINMDAGYDWKDPPGFTFRTYPSAADYNVQNPVADPELWGGDDPDLFVSTLKNGTMRGYENGVEYSVTEGDARFRSIAWKNDLNPSYPICIGSTYQPSEPGGDMRHFQGNIYMIAMWNKAFTEDQVVDLFLGGPSTFIPSESGFCGNPQGLSGVQMALIGLFGVFIVGGAGYGLYATTNKDNDRFSSRMSIMNKIKRNTTASTYSTDPDDQLAGLMEVARPKVKAPVQRTPDGEKDKSSAVRGAAAGKFSAAGIDANPATYGSLNAPQKPEIPIRQESSGRKSPPKRRKSSGSKKRKKSGSKMAAGTEPGLPKPRKENDVPEAM